MLGIPNFYLGNKKRRVNLYVYYIYTIYSAGGFVIEHPLLSPHIRIVKGSMDSVMGLPVPLMSSLIDQVRD
jgi:hypothetical protein